MNPRPLLLVTAGVLLVELVASAIAWPQLAPGAQIPVHWGIDGQPNGYADAWVGLLLLPGMTVLLGPFLAFIPRFDPRSANLARSASAYRWIVGSALVLLGAVHVVVVLWALGWEIDITRFLGVAIGLLFAIIGNFLGKTRSSWFLGIRTPWTLSSERSWTRTHRLGGYLFVALGLASAFVALVIGPQAFFWTLIGGLTVTVVALVIVSYLAWRDDPDRRTL